MQFEVRIRMKMKMKMAARGLACCSLLVVLPVAARASAAAVADSAQISALEDRAKTASPREQAALYADIADNLSLLASKQMADGDVDAAQKTLVKLESTSAAIESGLMRDSKSLKKTEILLHTTARRLGDLMRSAGDARPLVMSALKRLNKAQTALLSTIFEK